MQIAAVIAEYNPFHLAHAWQLKEIRRKMGENTAILVPLSGYFVQRGEPSVLSPWNRADLAVQMGADLVFELPYSCSCASAPLFAQGALSLLKGTGFSFHLFFGIENGSLDLLKKIDFLLMDQQEQISFRIKENIRKGLGFAAARSQALSVLLNQEKSLFPPVEDWNTFLKQPNVILGLEYIRAARMLGLSQRKCQFHTLPRLGHPEEGENGSRASNASTSYAPIHTQSPLKNTFLTRQSDPRMDFYQALSCTPSASELRTILHSCKQPGDAVEKLSGLIPDPVLAKLLLHFQQFRIWPSWEALWPTLLTLWPQLYCSSDPDLPDLSPALAHRIRNVLEQNPEVWTDPQLALTKISDRNTPRSQFKRLCCHALTHYTNELKQIAIHQGCCYLKPLSYNKTGRYLLRKLRKTAQIPVILKASDFLHFPEKAPLRLQGLQEVRAGMLWHSFFGGDPKEVWKSFASCIKSNPLEFL